MGTPDKWVNLIVLGHEAGSLVMEFSYRENDLFVT